MKKKNPQNFLCSGALWCCNTAWLHADAGHEDLYSDEKIVEWCTVQLRILKMQCTLKLLSCGQMKFFLLLVVLSDLISKVNHLQMYVATRFWSRRQTLEVDSLQYVNGIRGSNMFW